MRKLAFILIALTTCLITTKSFGQAKYALLIGGPIDKQHWKYLYNKGWFPEDYQDFFWNDVFLMKKLLIDKFDYSAENVKVIFDDGYDYSPPNNPGVYPSRYKKAAGMPDITAPDHLACTYENVKGALQDLIPNINQNDFVFIYIFTHGRYPGDAPPYFYGILCPQQLHNDYSYDDTDYMYADEFTSLVTAIPAQKKVIWMQPCYSGGFIDYFNQQLPTPYPFIVNYSSGAFEEAYEADNLIYEPGYGLITFTENESPFFYGNWGSDCHHGEFSYHLYSALNGETPTINETSYNSINPIPLTLADANSDGIISVAESYNWASTYQSRQWQSGGEHFYYQDPDNISAKTSLKYPNIVSSINDLKINSTNTGIYGITADVVVNSNNTLDFGPNSKIYLLNNAKIIVQGGATLNIQNGVSIFGNGQNSIQVENGSINLGLNVLFSNREPNQVFYGLYLTGYATSTQIDHATFKRSQLWNESSDLSIDHSSFSNEPTSEEACYGIYSTGGNISIMHSTFNGASLYTINPGKHFDWQATVRYCTFQNTGINIDGYRNFNIDYNNITWSYENGITLSHAGNGTSGNQSISHNSIYNCLNGLLLNNTYANLVSNYIHNNQRGVYIGNNSNIVMVSSVDFPQSLLNCDLEEIYIEKGCFPVNIMYNKIIDEDNIGGNYDPLLRYNNYPPNPETKVITNNCWGNYFNPGLDLIGQSVTFIYDPIWYPGAPASTEDPQIVMYTTAMNQYDSGNYIDAKLTFKSIIEQYPKSTGAQAAMKQLFQLEELADNDYYSLQQYFLTNDSITSDSSLAITGEYLANRCNEKIENWPDEIAWFENKILNPESETDSIFAILDLSHVYLLMNDSSLKASQIIGSLPQYKPKSLVHFKLYSDTLNSMLPADKNYKRLMTKVNNLSQGELLQNIPNPVIGNTDIYYKLNLNGSIQIVISDMLGRKIKEFELGSLTKGSHKTNINLSDLKSGVYSYSLIIDGKRSDVKKLIVI